MAASARRRMRCGLILLVVAVTLGLATACLVVLNG
jgi:hypothetical protein